MPNIGSPLIGGRFDPVTGHDHNGVNSKKVLATDVTTTGMGASNVVTADGAGGTSTAHIYNSTQCTQYFARIEHVDFVGPTTIDNVAYADMVTKDYTVINSSYTVVVVAHALINVYHDWGAAGYYDMRVDSKLLYDSTEIEEKQSWINYRDYVTNVGGVYLQGNALCLSHIASVTGISGALTFKWQLKANAAYDVRTAQKGSLVLLIYT